MANHFLCDDKPGWMTQFPCRVVIVRLIMVGLRVEHSVPAADRTVNAVGSDGYRAVRNALINYQFMY